MTALHGVDVPAFLHFLVLIRGRHPSVQFELGAFQDADRFIEVRVPDPAVS